MTSVKRVLSDRYQLDHVLAVGGMGTVWRARDQRLDRAVAVKELNGAGLTLPMAIQRFGREARAAARLAHPNIVALHDVGMEDGRPYLVMELIDGHSVAADLENGPLSPATAVSVAAQTCDGLAAAHAAGIIHRDIKPANLMITDGGVVKICDFGIARLHDAAGDITLSGEAPPLGSYKYLAPEQATGAPIDARTDLYALGCTLYAMLTGAPPFSGDPQAVLQQHLTKPPPALATSDDIPAELAALVQQLLRKEPKERPAGALEVKTRLAAVAQRLAMADAPEPQIPLSVLPPAAPPGTRPPAPPADRLGEPVPARRRRLPVVAGVSFAIVLAVLATLGLTKWWPRVDDVGTGSAPLVLTSASGPPGRSSASSALSAAAPSPAATANRPVKDDDPIAPAISPASSRSTSTPADPVVALRLSIRQQVDAGYLNPSAAPDLYKKVDEIAQATHDGKTSDARTKAKDFRNRLADLHEAGTLATAGFDHLNADLDRLVNSLSLTEPAGPPKPPPPHQ